MKKKRIVAIITIALLSIFTFAQSTNAQKPDRIIKRDYTIIEGTISKLSETTVEYSLPNEKLVNSLDVANVARIEFANGRVQTFDAVPGSQANITSASAAETAATPTIQAQAVKENVIAVLPIPYVNADNLQSSEEMAKFAQNDVYSKLIAKASNIFPLSVQDLRTTNSLLRKANIDYKNIDEIPIDELHKILGADHIIAAKISYTTKDIQNSQTYRSGEVKGQNNKVKGKDVSASSSQNNTYYYYHVYFDLYKNNNKIYTQSRKPAFAIKDSWVDAMTFLLKKSPIYVK
jgi:hypothetical protein